MKDASTPSHINSVLTEIRGKLTIPIPKPRWVAHVWRGAHLVFLLQRKRKTIDDGAKNLQELRNPIVALRLKNEAVEDIVNGFAYEGPMHHELPVNSVQDRLQVIALPGVLAVKKLQKPDHEVLVDVPLRCLCICIV